MSTVIRVENVSKQYRLGEIGTGSIAHDLNRWWHRFRGKEDPYLRVGETNDRTTKGTSAYAWALKDVSFEVEQGEVIGIIGRNGAGKSTLLKILSRVTQPTTGQVRMKGRIASLLEVGTGFHPELSGRENIYLNGSILGMRKSEISAKFDEIVEFSGCERYIDTPVKRYSSGMYVRLAFAVAAHLEPEILIIDEVLAVGDTEFQKKCIGKMRDVAVGGRTVIFVSHNIPTIKQLCKKSVLFKNGAILFNGLTHEAIDQYQIRESAITEYHKTAKPGPDPQIIFAKLKLETNNQRYWVEIATTILAIKEQKCALEIVISDDSGNPVGIASAGLFDQRAMIKLSQGDNAFTCKVVLPNLAQGNYRVGIQLTQPWVKHHDKIDTPLGFELIRSELESGIRPLEQKWGHGCLELPVEVKSHRN